MALITQEQREQELAEQQAFEDREVMHEREQAEALRLVHITRDLVLKGSSYVEEVAVPELGVGAYLRVHPLTDAEFNQVQRIVLGGTTIDELEAIERNLDMAAKLEERLKYTAVALGLTTPDEKWKPEDVGLLPPNVPDRLYTVIAKISGFPRPSMARQDGAR